MWKHAAIAIKFTIVTTIILGLLYPLAITGLAQAIFPKQANGSIIERGGKIVGSKLIGQTFSRPEYFHARLSAAFDPNPPKDKNAPQDTYVSSGSNLAPTSKTLVDRVKNDVDKLSKENPGLKAGNVPADMVTTSASGFDPDITPANAYAQVARVAKARGASEEAVRKLVTVNITGRQLGILGEPRVNVLKLNLALDEKLTKAK